MPSKKVKETKKEDPEKIRNASITINNWCDSDITNLNGLSFRYMVVGKEGKKCKYCMNCKSCFICKECKTYLSKLYEVELAKFKKMKEVRFDCIRKLDKDCKECKINSCCYNCEDKCIYKTPHLQCYVEFNNSVSFNAVRKQIPGGHIEHVRSCKDKIEYCKKEGDFQEYGICKKQGERTDIDEIRSLALTGGMREVTKICNASQIRVAEAFLSHNEPARNWKPQVFWIFGPPGVGKGRLADAILKQITGENDIFVVYPTPMEDASDPYEKSDASKWWNGYDGHANVIIDDFRHSWWPLTYLLKILDRRKMLVENKGGMRQFRAKNIIITSIFPPEKSYSNASNYIPVVDLPKEEKLSFDPHEEFEDENGEPSNQLLRRIDEIIELKYSYDKENKYIEHQAKYINRKLKGTHHLSGRFTTEGIVKFEIDENQIKPKYSD